MSAFKSLLSATFGLAATAAVAGEDITMKTMNMSADFIVANPIMGLHNFYLEEKIYNDFRMTRGRAFRDLAAGVICSWAEQGRGIQATSHSYRMSHATPEILGCEKSSDMPEAWRTEETQVPFTVYNLFEDAQDGNIAHETTEFMSEDLMEWNKIARKIDLSAGTVCLKMSEKLFDEDGAENTAFDHDWGCFEADKDYIENIASRLGMSPA